MRIKSLIHVIGKLMAVKQRCRVISVACFVSLVSSDRMLCTMADNSNLECIGVIQPHHLNLLAE